MAESEARLHLMVELEELEVGFPDGTTTTNPRGGTPLAEDHHRPSMAPKSADQPKESYHSI